MRLIRRPNNHHRRRNGEVRPSVGSDRRRWASKRTSGAIGKSSPPSPSPQRRGGGDSDEANHQHYRIRGYNHPSARIEAGGYDHPPAICSTSQHRGPANWGRGGIRQLESILNFLHNLRPQDHLSQVTGGKQWQPSQAWSRRSPPARPAGLTAGLLRPTICMLVKC